MEVPKPTEARRKLNFLVGRWASQEKLCLPPWELIEVGRYNFRLEVSKDGGQWTTKLEGDYAREGHPGSVEFPVGP